MQASLGLPNQHHQSESEEGKMPMKREMIYAEKGLKLFFYDKSGPGAAEDKPSMNANAEHPRQYACAVDREGQIYHGIAEDEDIAERQTVSFDHPTFQLQLDYDYDPGSGPSTSICHGMPFEMAQNIARAIVGKPVHGKKGWLLVTDGKFGDEGKPIYEDRYDRLLYNENGISIHVNDENYSFAHHAPPGLTWRVALAFWITVMWMKFIGQRFIRLRKRLRTRRFRQQGPEFILTIGRWFVCISSATAAALATVIISKKTDVTN